MININSLPSELLESIFSKVGYVDRDSLAQVCKEWYWLIQSVWDQEKHLVNKKSVFGDKSSRLISTTDYTLSMIKKCRNLETLFWCHESNVLHFEILDVVSQSKELQHLELQWPYPLYVDNLLNLVSLTKLKTLSLNGVILNNAWLFVHDLLPQLQVFSKGELTLQELELIVRKNSIKTLNIDRVIGNLDQVIYALSSSEFSLQELRVTSRLSRCYTNIDGQAGDKIFKRLPCLTLLRIDTRYSALPYLKYVPNLVEFEWFNVSNGYFAYDYRVRVNANDFGALGYNTEYTIYELMNDRELSENLELYSRPEENLSYNFIIFLDQHSKLQHLKLNISNCFFPSECLQNLSSQCPLLKKFYLYQEIEEAMEPDNHIVAHLSSCDNLGTMVLLNFEVTKNSVLENLHKFKLLSNIKIDNVDMFDSASIYHFIKYAVDNPRRKILVDIDFNITFIPDMPKNIKFSYAVNYPFSFVDWKI